MTKKRRADMNVAEFRRACERRGFIKVPGPFSYYSLGDTPVQASTLNAGPTRREQLAYLIREHRIAEKKFPRKGMVEETDCE